MVVKTINDDVLKTKCAHIAFGTNTEGFNDFGFAGKIANLYWPELKYCGKQELGSVLSKTIGDTTYHALVCHSLNSGWQNQREIIKNCFDKIPTNEPIATIAIGNGVVGMLNGADFRQIVCGMYDSNKQIILHAPYTLDAVINCYMEETGRVLKKKL